MTLVGKLRENYQKLFRSSPDFPHPEVLTIESSYTCNLKCVMCPRHFEGVPQGVFTLEMFEEHIEPYLKNFKVLSLTGWGEPLMNKDLPEILRRSREAGLWTTFITNGLLLKDPLDRKVLEAHPKMVSVSCDAAKAETYEYVRGKGTFDTLKKRLTSFRDLRKSMDVETEMQWIFVMLKYNYTEMPDAIRLAADKGFEYFVAKHIETVINRDELGDALWNTGIGPDIPEDVIKHHDEILEESKQVAEEVGIQLYLHPRKMDHKGMCMVRPTNQVFVDYMGRVSNCCYLNVNDVRPYNTPEEKPKDDGVYGELKLKTLAEMMNSDEYKNFQKEWLQGGVPEACKNCLQVYRMHTTSEDKVSGKSADY